MMPLGITLVLLFLRIFWPKRWLLPSAIFILLFFSLGIVADTLTRLIEKPWQRKLASSAPQADAIVVLSGGGIYPRGRNRVIEWRDPDRFLAGIELYKANKAQTILFTGEGNDKLTSGDLYIQEAKKLGIPSKSLSSTPFVFNTADEAREVKRFLNSKNNGRYPRIILVTSAFHMNRAKLVFEKQGIHVTAFPVDFEIDPSREGGPISPYGFIPSSGKLAKSSMVIREYIGRFIYRLKKHKIN